jgi:putative membrane protein
MKSALLTLVLTLAASSLTLAQMHDPSSGSDMMVKSSSTDATFLKKLAEGDLAEVDAGRLASQKSSNADVKEFGEQMVKDHSKNDSELKTLAASQGIEVPTTIDSKHASQKNILEKASGSNFDSEYIKMQVQAHEKTVQLLQHEIQDGQDAAVKAFAQKTLAVVNHHLEMAKHLQSQLSNSVAERGSQSSQ